MTDGVDKIIAAAKALLKSVQSDESAHGGLLSRETTRRGDELRLAISRYENANKGT